MTSYFEFGQLMYIFVFDYGNTIYCTYSGGKYGRHDFESHAHIKRGRFSACGGYENIGSSFKAF